MSLTGRARETRRIDRLTLGQAMRQSREVGHAIHESDATGVTEPIAAGRELAALAVQRFDGDMVAMRIDRPKQRRVGHLVPRDIADVASLAPVVVNLRRRARARRLWVMAGMEACMIVPEG